MTLGRHWWLAFWTVWNVLAVAANLWMGDEADWGWVAASAFFAVCTAGVWSLEIEKDRAVRARREQKRTEHEK